MSLNDENRHITILGRTISPTTNDEPRSLAQLSPSSSLDDITNPIPSQTPNTNRHHHSYAPVNTQADDDDEYGDQYLDSRRLSMPTDENGKEAELGSLSSGPLQNRRILSWGRAIAILAVISLACLSIAAVMRASTPSSDTSQPGRDKKSVADSVLAAMNKSVDPCEDFYEYACGSWIRTNKLPPDRNSVSKSFSSVHDRIQSAVKGLLEGKMQKSSNPAIAKAGLFYASCINQHSIGPVNISFLSPLRDYFTQAKDTKSFVKLLAKLYTLDSAILFNMQISADDKHPNEYAVFLSQAPLGLGQPSNYLEGSANAIEMRKRYLICIQRILDPAAQAGLVPNQNHTKVANDILEFETKLANFSFSRSYDPNARYNKRKIKDMPSSLYLNEFFIAMGVDSRDINNRVIINVPSYFDSINVIMESLDTNKNMRAIVKAHLGFHAAVSGAKRGLLGEAAYTELFKFGQFVYGTKQMPERWEICQSLTNEMLGEAVGKAFVEEHFSEAQMNIAKTLSQEITKSFGTRLKKLDWMDSGTREAAESKLSAIEWKVGYSSKLDKYKDVTITGDSLSSNVMSCIEHAYKKSIDRLGKSVDKTQWFMLPHTTNAYYSPVSNQMMFPAGILRPPFFSDAYPDAMNYGSIGVVVGHEMSHGFDANGRRYDKNGKLRLWWSEQSGKEYEKRSQCYVNLYNTFKPANMSVYVNGNRTLNENIADTNGVNVAYQAFKSLPSNRENGIDPPNVSLAKELTNDQLFFVAYAQTWCTVNRPETLKVQIMADSHSPHQFRVLGPLSQSDAFAKAFQCRRGSRYNPTDKCHLW